MNSKQDAVRCKSTPYHHINTKTPLAHKTEQLLFLYPYMPESAEKNRISVAIVEVEAEMEKYRGVISLRYFEHRKISELAMVYNVSMTMIRKVIKKMLVQLTWRLFPEAVYEEIVSVE